MKSNLLKKIFSSGLQAVSVQILGVLFFIIISYYLPKNEFGIIGWSNATAVLLTTALSFGLEQVVIRRIAASDRSDWAAAAYLFHAFAGSIIAFLVLITLSWLFGDTNEKFVFLPWFFAAQALIYIGTPLKQFLNAKHKFAPYGVIAIISNICKISLAYYGLQKQMMSVDAVYKILIVCAMIELVGLLVYVFSRTGFVMKFKWIAYTKLLKESVPQYIAMVFDTGLSRIDWILLGWIKNNDAVGDYSFAYRAYELTRLPITVIAPILINVFSRMLVNGNKLDEEKQATVRKLYTVVMFLAMTMPVVLNMLWAPGLDWAYNGKYGSANATEFLLLSLCIPFQFTINLLWTLTFASKKYKKVTTITIITAVVNLILNLILIPLYGGLGAAIAYLITNVVQMVGYYTVVEKQIMHFPLVSLYLFLFTGVAVYFASTAITSNIALQLLMAVGVYVGVALFSKHVNKGHVQTLTTFLKK